MWQFSALWKKCLYSGFESIWISGWSVKVRMVSVYSLLFVLSKNVQSPLRGRYLKSTFHASARMSNSQTPIFQEKRENEISKIF